VEAADLAAAAEVLAAADSAAANRGGGGFGGGGLGGFGGGGFGGGNGLGGGGVSRAAGQTASDLAGQVTVVADEDTNSLLVMTAPKNFERVKQVLDELDRAVPQVLIKVLIAEVTHDNARPRRRILGAQPPRQWQRAADRHGLRHGQSDRRAGVQGPGEQLHRHDPRAGYGRQARRALAAVHPRQSDNQLAAITVGQEMPFITNTRTTDTGQTINTIQYQPTSASCWT
jgi:hypothetical protein